MYATEGHGAMSIHGLDIELSKGTGRSRAPAIDSSRRRKQEGSDRVGTKKSEATLPSADSARRG